MTAFSSLTRKSKCSFGGFFSIIKICCIGNFIAAVLCFVFGVWELSVKHLSVRGKDAKLQILGSLVQVGPKAKFILFGFSTFSCFTLWGYLFSLLFSKRSFASVYELVFHIF